KKPPSPFLPCRGSAAKQSRCRSLPAGDRIGGHGARQNRRQGRLLQCPTHAPRRNEITVGACLQAIASEGTPPEIIACKAGSYSAVASAPCRSPTAAEQRCGLEGKASQEVTGADIQTDGADGEGDDDGGPEGVAVLDAQAPFDEGDGDGAAGGQREERGDQGQQEVFQA